MKKHRVVVWGTGNIASIAVRCLHDRPDIELMGVWAHEATDGEKIGTDAGLLYGENPIGVVVTGDADALFAMKPDCAMVGINSSPDILISIYERFLLAGINVVGTSMASLIYPPGNYDQEMVKRLEAAAQKGQATMYVSGIEPGFACDDLVVKLLSASNTVKKITASERALWDAYPDPMQKQYFGFGMPMDFICAFEQPGSVRGLWGSGVQMIADAVGYQLDEIREVYEKVPAEFDFKTALGIIEKGTCGAILCAAIGIIDDKEKIEIQHVNRLHPDLAPKWGTSPRDGLYEIIIEGDPNISCHLMIGENPKFVSYESMIVTCLRAANGIKYVCEASPGLKNALTLPNTIPNGLFRSENATPNPGRYPGSEVV
jgi:hypothetical protein